ncbi:hypothetical protein NDU88_002190 [Pleurodeles waltl]|uniref:Uncharacterized protein n=1 Tax=Pleurodeles waltl TaxID=8319 RepID=A0AAV7LBV8_PLEWA|nr:hypothetical protein NDU88_002190 [Pleurodeles waltl]
MEAGGTGSDHRAILPAAGPLSQASRASPAPPPGYPRPTPRVGPKLPPGCKQMSTKPTAGAGFPVASPLPHRSIPPAVLGRIRHSPPPPELQMSPAGHPRQPRDPVPAPRRSSVFAPPRSGSDF